MISADKELGNIMIPFDMKQGPDDDASYIQSCIQSEVDKEHERVIKCSL